MSDSFRIGVREFQSRLMVGTGKYANDQLAIDAIRESGADIVTMAIRRVNLGQNKDESNILELISPDEFTICLLYTSPSPRDAIPSRMPSSA